MSGPGKDNELSRKDVKRLVGAAYSVSFPYLLLMIGSLLIVFWLLILFFS